MMRSVSLVAFIALLSSRTVHAQPNPGGTTATAPLPASPAPVASDDPGAGPGAAAPTESPEILEARDAFRLGSTLAKQGRWSDALAAFERSARIKAHPVTTYNLAYCARALGQFVRAYQSFEAAIADSGEGRLPEAFQTQARAYLVELKQRIARATVTLGSPLMSIRVDGRAIAALGKEGDRTVYFSSPAETPSQVRLPPSFELWLDPGDHVFIVSQPGSADATKLHAFAPGTAEALLFPAMVEGPPPQGQHAEAGVTVGPDRTWAIVSLGVGAAGLITSGVFAILSLNLKSDLESHCGASTPCPASDADDVDRMQRFADYATVGLVVGGVGTAVGTYLWFTAKPERTGPGAATRITPWIGPGSAGVTGRF